MAKSAKRSTRQRSQPTAGDLHRSREQAELRRTIRHQKTIRRLSRALTNAMRVADRSVVELHDFLSQHPAIAEVAPIHEEQKL